jgi:hypothetical protein
VREALLVSCQESLSTSTAFTVSSPSSSKYIGFFQANVSIRTVRSLISSLQRPSRCRFAPSSSSNYAFKKRKGIDFGVYYFSVFSLTGEFVRMKTVLMHT